MLAHIINSVSYRSRQLLGLLTYPGMTLLYPLKLSESLRISNGTNLRKSFSIFYDLLMLYEYVPVIYHDQKFACFNPQ